METTPDADGCIKRAARSATRERRTSISWSRELVAWTQLDLADPTLTMLRVTRIGSGLDKVGAANRSWHCYQFHAPAGYTVRPAM